MFKAAKSCMGRIVTVVFLVAVAYAGFRWGPAVFPQLEEWLDLRGDAAAGGPEPSQELADRAVARFERFRSDAAEGDRMALDGVEVTSVIRYVLPGRLPAGVGEPEVELDDGEVQLSARIALDAFPAFPDLEGILDILPDTVALQLEGALLRFGDSEAALMIRGIEASRIPLPRRLLPDILRALGREDREGLPADALLVPLPPGISRVHVEGDSLVLVSER